MNLPREAVVLEFLLGRCKLGCQVPTHACRRLEPEAPFQWCPPLSHLIISLRSQNYAGQLQMSYVSYSLINLL